ncbi:ribonuclease H-like domain-containing protein [Tanacetum coccineum]
MVTRAKAGISKPLARMNCHATTTSPIPRSHLHALRDPNWHKAMVDEYNALISNGTWALVPRPANVNIVRSMWLFKHKFNADGSLMSQVVKPATIRTVLSLAVTRDWPIHQLDVKNAFLHGQLSETVYMHQPPGFVDSAHPDYSKFAEEILERAHMQHCNPCKTPVDTESKLGSDGDPVSDPTLYRSLAGALHVFCAMFVGLLTMDFSFMSRPLVNSLPYTDADWAGCPVTRRSTSGYCVFLGDNLLSWSAKRQVTLSRSSAEAEYRGVANVVAETAWIRNLLLELHTPLFTYSLSIVIM